MPKYERSFAPEVELNEDEQELENNRGTPPDNELSAEEKNWKKRYGDLRSHTQKQVNELNAKVEALTRQLNTDTSNKFDLPTTEAEVEAWARKYPQVAAIVTTIARTNARQVEENLESRLQKITEREQNNDKEKAQLELAKLHPDFFDEIKDNEDFHAWLITKSQRTQDSIYENDLDYQWAGETISLFKRETGFKQSKPAPRLDTRRDDAREVRASRPTNPGTGMEPIFKESEIQNMTGKEFEKNMEAIEKAQREGRIDYDITSAVDAARG